MTTNKRLYCLSFGLAGVLAMTQPLCLAQEFHTEVVEVEAEEATPSEVGVTVESGGNFIQAEPGAATAISETITNFAYNFEQSTPVEENAKLKPIRIFCKVLDHQLSEALGNDYASPSFLSEGCRGYWIPPNDVLITLNVSFPVRVEEKQDSAKENGKDSSDLWNLYEKQSSGEKIYFSNPAGEVYTTVVKTESMQEKVSQLKKTITDVIAQYGSRLKESFPFDRLSIVVNGGSGRNAMTIRRAQAPVSEKTYTESAKDAQSREMDKIKRILSLKEEQTALAEENLKRLQQQADSGRVSISEVDQAKEKLMDRKIELEKMHQEIEQIKQKQEDGRKAVSERRFQMEREGMLRVEPEEGKIAIKKIEERVSPSVDVLVSASMEMKNGASNSTLIFQIKGEQVSDAEAIQNNIQITSY